MRVLVQRVKNAKVTIEGKVHGQIGQGYLLLIGFTGTDTSETVATVIKKVLELRIFDDQDGKMNLSIFDVGGSVLSISQFTLYADIRKGRRPGFENAAKYQDASELYDLTNKVLSESNLKIETGIFGADMKVELLNDGPITIMVDSEELTHG